jgi:hypothetical protein
MVGDDLMAEQPEVPHIHAGVAGARTGKRVEEVERQRPRTQQRDTRVADQRREMTAHVPDRHWQGN